MCRYEALAYVQKLKELENGVSYVHKLNELARRRGCGVRIGATHVTNSNSHVSISEIYRKSRGKW